MTKIDIVSGFLGAGKTTLIKKLLKESFTGEKVVLIENEFGEISIDGGFLKESGVEIREMASGCICCSLVGDFYTSLQEVIAAYSPDRILIEPSGVGKLSDVISAVSRVVEVMKDSVILNSYTTVVDVNRCKTYVKNFGEFYKNQLKYAGSVVLTRTDKATPDKIEACLELIRTFNSDCPVVTTPLEQLSGDKILSVIEGIPSLKEELLAEETCPVCGGHHHGHEHEHEHEHHHDHEH
ncbi:MAG: GTP-binding protein, partial [Lachnospiraceae bacterium]|nr:GTP-binding protein [Lachnospiraceae bacterium]